MFESTDRSTYEREMGTYRQPRYAMRKIAARVLPRLPGFRLRRMLYGRLGYRIDPGIKFIGLDTYLDDLFPELIRIDAGTVIAFRVIIVAHDDSTHTVAPIHIGKNVFIGTGAIVLPGVEIADGAIVAAGTVVHRDVPAGATAVGGSGMRILDKWEVTP